MEDVDVWGSAGWQCLGKEVMESQNKRQDKRVHSHLFVQGLSFHNIKIK